MTEGASTVGTDVDLDLCTYPGCARQRRPDAATGRPSRYCERADDGGPVHNRASAFKARRARVTASTGTAVPVQAHGSSAPVSMARATLEQRLAEFPGRVAEMRGYLDDVVAAVAAAGDVEAAGAEVEDAHRDALATVVEAERRAAQAERAARLAEDRAERAERDRDEADQLAEAAEAAAAQVRQECVTEVAAVRAEAGAAVADAHKALAERSAEVDRASDELAAARVEAAAALSAKQAADEAVVRERETADQLRRDLDHARRETGEVRQQMQAQIELARQATQAADAENGALRVELATKHAEAEAARRSSEVLRADLERHRDEARAAREAHAAQIAQMTEALSLAARSASPPSSSRDARTKNS